MSATSDVAPVVGTRGTAIPAAAHSLSTSGEETRSGALADAGDSEPRSRLNPRSYSGSSSMLPSRRGDREWEEVLIGAQGAFAGESGFHDERMRSPVCEKQEI